MLALAGVLILSCDEEDSPAAADARPAVKCCELDAPSCHCPVVGTRGDGTCYKVCDATGSWVREIDENGCPRYRVPGGSCLTRRDTGVPKDPCAACMQNDCPAETVACRGIDAYAACSVAESCVAECTSGSAPGCGDACLASASPEARAYLLCMEAHCFAVCDIVPFSKGDAASDGG